MQVEVKDKAMNYPQDKGWVTNKEVQQMRQWREDGYSLSDICTWTGRHRKTVIKYLKGVPAKGTPIRVCVPIIKTLANLGWTQSEIGRATKASRPAVHQALKNSRKLKKLRKDLNL